MRLTATRLRIRIGSNRDRSMRFSALVDVREMVCENMAITGDFQLVFAKRPKQFSYKARPQSAWIRCSGTSTARASRSMLGGSYLFFEVRGRNWSTIRLKVAWSAALRLLR